MKVQIDVGEGSSVVATAECEASADDTVELVILNAAGQLGLAADEILLDLSAGEDRFERGKRVDHLPAWAAHQCGPPGGVDVGSVGAYSAMRPSKTIG